MTLDESRTQIMIVVGGGAGIGAAAARLLHRRGARVACIDRDGKRSRAVASELDESLESAAAFTADVTDTSALHGAVTAVAEKWGHVDGLVNCAGITGATNIRCDQVDLADFDKVVAVNLRGAFVVSQAILPIFVRQKYGRLLHVASIAGKEGNAGMVAYSASKAGLIGLVKAAGKEYANDGITVNALAPAVIWTDLVDQMPQEQVEYMTSRIPMGRLGTLDEAAEMIAWILSPAASFTTGFTFDLSGGRATY
jgi:3-oxoacyl-[acyl-carrier protein] reductase